MLLMRLLLASRGRDDKLRDALKRFEAVPKEKINPDYLLLDELA